MESIQVSLYDGVSDIGSFSPNLVVAKSAESGCPFDVSRRRRELTGTESFFFFSPKPTYIETTLILRHA
jgi:hypothetical protein